MLLPYWIPYIHSHICFSYIYFRCDRDKKYTDASICVVCSFSVVIDAERGSSVSGRAPHLWHITASRTNTEYTQKRGFSAFWIQSDLCLQMQLFDDVSRERKCFDSNSNLCIFLIKDKRRIKVLNTNYKEKKQKCDIQFLSRYIISIEPTKIKFYSAHVINQFCPLP